MRKVHSFWATAALLALATVLGSASASAGLCVRCANKSFSDNIGKCASCGAATSSGAFKLCPACSIKRNQCEACGGILNVAASNDTAAKETKPVVAPVAVAAPEVKADTPPVAAAAPEVKPVVSPVEIKPVVPPIKILKPAAAAPAAPAVK